MWFYNFSSICWCAQKGHAILWLKSYVASNGCDHGWQKWVPAPVNGLTPQNFVPIRQFGINAGQPSWAVYVIITHVCLIRALVLAACSSVKRLVMGAWSTVMSNFLFFSCCQIFGRSDWLTGEVKLELSLSQIRRHPYARNVTLAPASYCQPDLTHVCWLLNCVCIITCARMRSRVERLVPSICIFICIYVYVYMWPKKRLFCILPVVIHHESLYDACSKDFYVAKDAIDS